MQFPDATMFKHLTYMEVLKKKIAVMDATAVSLCMGEKLPIRVFNISVEGNIPKIIFGADIGTSVTVED